VAEVCIGLKDGQRCCGGDVLLEKPDIQDGRVIDCLQDAYGMSIVQIEFLPLGADQNTALYRAVAETGAT
jgi:spectinomycin phosphotransferase